MTLNETKAGVTILNNVSSSLNVFSLVVARRVCTSVYGERATAILKASVQTEAAWAFRNVCIQTEDYTVQQPRKPQPKLTPS
jgi:hypothetical protein